LTRNSLVFVLEFHSSSTVPRGRESPAGERPFWYDIMILSFLLCRRHCHFAEIPLAHTHTLAGNLWARVALHGVRFGAIKWAWGRRP